MSTNDVPGAKKANNDKLAMGCWAEHDDGSLIFVQSTEGDKVVFEIFDLSAKARVLLCEHHLVIFMQQQRLPG